MKIKLTAGVAFLLLALFILQPVTMLADSDDVLMQLEPNLEPHMEPVFEPELEPQLEPQFEPELESQLEPQFDPEFEPELEPQPEPQPDPQCECDLWCECFDCEPWCGCDYHQPLPQCECDDQDGLICCLSRLVDEIESGASELWFGTDITVSADRWIDLHGIHIETGDYSLIVEGDLLLSEDAIVSGSGLSGAVIEVSDGGRLHIGDATFDSAPLVSATGSGGVALAFESGANYFSYSYSFMKISANGGIGVLSEIPLYLICHFIDAGNGRGIVSTEEVDLFLCRVEGGSAAVQAPEIAADTSVLIPSYGTGIMQRSMYAISPNRLVLGIGEAFPYEDYSEALYTAVIYRTAEASDRVIYQDISLNVPAIDTSEPGNWPIMPKVEGWMGLCGLLPYEEAPFTVAVRDLRIPAFQHLDVMFGSAYLHFRYDGSDVGSLILWRSDDEGGSWHDATSFHSFDYNFWDDTHVLILEEQIGHPVWLVWETRDYGLSEVLIVDLEKGCADENPGGDRSGIDRGESASPSDNEASNPTRPPSISQPVMRISRDNQPIPPSANEAQIFDEQPPTSGLMPLPYDIEDAAAQGDITPDDTLTGGIQVVELMSDMQDDLLPTSLQSDSQEIIPAQSLLVENNDISELPPSRTEETHDIVPSLAEQGLNQQSALPDQLIEADSPLAPPTQAPSIQTAEAGMPYRDSFVPAAIAGVLALLAAAAFLIISAKRRVRR